MVHQSDILLYCLLGIVVLLANAHVPSSEIDALKALYDATNGDSWVEICREGWNFTGTDIDPCRDAWYGITCTSSDCANSTCRITWLTLPACNLDGSLPVEMTTFASLGRFTMSSNHLVGTLPTEFAQLSELYYIRLRINSLTGTIPSIYSTLHALNLLDVSDNFISGTLPHEFSVLTKLSIFQVNNNALSGTIPNDFFNGPNTRYVEVQDNHLFGAFPLLGQDIRTLFFANNAFSGVIPSYVFDRPMLSTLSSDNNCFTGVLPNAISLNSRLTQITLRNNFVSGTVPYAFANFTRCKTYGLSKNILQGMLPSFLTDEIELFDVSFNRFTGTIPLLSHSTESLLQYAYLHSNRLTGTLPSGFDKAKRLVHLMVFNNELTGTIPSSLGRLNLLNTLLLKDNRFHGNIGSIFLPRNSSTSQPFPALKILDISNNAFDGTIPREIFTLPKIEYASLGENCFNDDIPASICNATQLQVLIVEGLSSGQKCRDLMWDPFRLTNAYFVNAAHGSIPSCIFDMPQLKVLHASANGLAGTIPRLTDASALQDLKLSDNRLSGNVPSWLQRYAIASLDISRNRFSGTFDIPRGSSYNFTSSSSMSISGNRFSGEISRGFKRLRDVDVLVGNLFSCDSRDDLPEHDPERTAYVCGSDGYDIPLIVWSICVGGLVFVVVLILIVFKLRIRILGSVRSFIEAYVSVCRVALDEWHVDIGSLSEKHPHLCNFIITLRFLRKITIILTLIVGVCFSVIYVCFKILGHNGTHEYQYRWIVSAAYLSGVAPAIVMMLLLIASIGYFVSNTIP